MDRFDAMSILLEAIEAGSLSAAARRSGVPLATVSRKVSELETHLKTRLVNRSAKRLTLTDAGRIYVVACKRILEDLEEAERAASGEYSAPKGNLVITAPIVFGRLHVVPIIVKFLKAYPDVDIRLLLADGVVESLVEDRIDVAVRIAALPDSSLIATRVGSVRHVVCGSPSYFSERGIPQKPEDLSRHDCIHREGRSLSNIWTFGAGKSGMAVTIRARLTVNTAEANIDAAIAGLGITRLLSYQVAGAIRDGQLIPVLEEFETGPIPVSLVYGSQGLLPLKARAFLDFVAPRLKATLAEINA